MVDKIDRPERVSSYRIEASKEANDESSQQEQQQEAEHFVMQQEGEWQKFNASSMTLQSQKVAVERIAHLRFKSVMLRQGIPTLLAQIDWKNGQRTDSAMLRLSRVEDYLKLKAYPVLQEVPEEFWKLGPELEIAVPQKMGGSGSFSVKKMEEQQKTHQTHKKNKWPLRILATLLLFAFAILIWTAIFG